MLDMVPACPFRVEMLAEVLKNRAGRCGCAVLAWQLHSPHGPNTPAPTVMAGTGIPKLDTVHSLS
jgi:hypothetical protein